ncbi:FAD-dependent oxidoreductase [Marinibactrum halimedae]|uniref:Dehydrogenase n=1 Tax=Marinibactrum halimedae TaxID=1444977 RepID=A0AA37T658_9GAMM|nr:GMC family oxidoreductase [Marinibactrum halimedae]MCD9460041.1 GMC family oxidoreductase [Marinibactrum halimedae]GLS26439.1 dehydrogenase [Marinibactrum halimedae]
MLYDIEQNQFAPNLDTYDFAIAGAGPAGITLARKLARKGKRVALFEAGGMEYSQRSQDIYAPSSDSTSYPAATTRLRYFGGTSNHWAGRCRPFDPFDFNNDHNDYVLPGWPIEFDDINPYLGEAKDILDLGRDTEFKPLEGTDVIEQSFEKDRSLVSSPTRFNSKYKEELTRSDSIDLYINANVTNIVLDDKTKQIIEAFEVSDYTGNRHHFNAGTFVLALGGIENPRLLLNADSQLQHGVGNQHDMVGRCFMDHFNVRLCTFMPNSTRWQDVGRMEFYTKPSWSHENAVGTSNVTLSIFQATRVDGRFKPLKLRLADFACRYGYEDQLGKLFRVACAGEGLVTTLMEQEPHPDCRLMLSDETDSLGLRRLKTQWKMSELDKKTIRTIAKEISIQATESGLGRFQLPEYILDESLEIPNIYHCHHMGSTRMAALPEHGVVDKNCKVFGTNNLYVAGSSVFSRGGGNNPTMPLLQLALRLGDHLT